ncbi:hypothetical protein MCEL_15350 [Mycolicibacterium celeriflavum]|uniref:Uncharacterized protein n=1 Tax=Mycolicibacterium celeriflavum TaxID=1249101 RepID=A0A7I7RG57_MYCCF|nr:hypothetical protein MCEL_15350 [Mycolicibacterium celeriflavum]
MPTRTIAQLAAREAELVTELSEVRAEIAARAGQVDPPAKPAPKRRTRVKS